MAHAELSISRDVSINQVEVREIRGLPVLLSSDLAELYGVEPRSDASRQAQHGAFS